MSITPTPPTRPNTNPNHVPDYAAVGSPAWQVFAALPDLVNGVDAHFQYIFIAPGIPEAYHWMREDSFGALPAATDEATLRDRVAHEAATTSFRMVAFVADAGRRRTMAVVLATCRAAIRRTWAPVVGDIIANQSYSVDAAQRPAADGAIPVDMPTLCTVAEHALEVIAVKAIFDAGTPTWVPQVVKLAIASPITAGVTMVFTRVHHFQDPHKNIQRVVMRQVAGEGTTTLAGLPTDVFEDLVWHKASHPLSSGLLVWMARNEALKTKFSKLGIASATVRVPAQYDPERACSALTTLVRQGGQAAASHNVVANSKVADDLETEVAKALTATPTPATVLAAEKEVAKWTAAHGVHTAWLAGFMGAVNADTPRNLRNMSILQSKAVQRVRDEHPYAASQGQQHYDLATRWARGQARDGKLTGIGLFGSAAPASKGDDPPAKASGSGP